MARQPQTLIDNKKAYSSMSFAPTVDLRHNGQNGYIPDLRTYLTNSAYVRRWLIPILIEYPRGFDHLPNPEIWIGTLKSLVETQAKSITGLNGTINVQFVENPLGHSGEIQQDVSQITRARSTPTFVWVERQGRPVKLFFDGWIFNLIGHPDTQTPMINSYRAKDGVDNSNKYFDYLPDFNTMSVLFIEPDPFQRRVIDAYLCVNMMPNGSGDTEGSKEMGAAMQNRDITVEFTAITMQSMGVNQFAQALLDELNYSGLNPQNRRSAIEHVHANIVAQSMEVKNTPTESREEAIGYLGQVNGVATTNHYENSGGR